MRETLLAYRNRLLTNSRFHRVAMRIWPARWIARQQASSLFDLCSGFVYSQILAAAVELKLFEQLHQEPRTIAQLAKHMSLPIATAERLLRATTALHLTEHLSADRYTLGTLGCALLTNPGLRQLIGHHSMFYRDLADPVKLLNGHHEMAALEDFWAYAATHEGDEEKLTSTDTRAYSTLMAASQPMVAEQVLDTYSFAGFNAMLDVGGGTGVFATAVKARHPALDVAVFDLPGVIDNIDADRRNTISVHRGSNFSEALPTGFDLISLVRILHDHNDDAAQRLLTSVAASLPENGTLLIAEPLSHSPGARRIGEAYFNFYFLAMGKGNPRSYEQLREMLHAAGFNRVQRHKTAIPLITSVISARKAPIGL